jgi:sugar lactone lactonase YvrE
MGRLILFLLAMLFLSACSKQTTVVDFTPENSFTTGIEGPASDIHGNIYAVNYKKEGTVGKVTNQGDASIFLELPDGSIGNGIRFDIKNNMFIADYVNHRVYKVANGSNTPVVWAENNAMNQPNDLAISHNGFIYLSDPNWEKSTGNLWLVNKKQEIQLLEENMGTTNGIEVSPDGKTLYVNESVQRKVWKYTINTDGTVSNKKLFIEFEDHGLDGMRCDFKGNLYITRYGKGTVVIVSPKGKIIKEITLKGKKPSNITFGGADGKTCFVTLADRGCIESFTALNKGNFYYKTH